MRRPREYLLSLSIRSCRSGCHVRRGWSCNCDALVLTNALVIIKAPRYTTSIAWSDLSSFGGQRCLYLLQHRKRSYAREDGQQSKFLLRSTQDGSMRTLFPCSDSSILSCPRDFQLQCERSTTWWRNSIPTSEAGDRCVGICGPRVGNFLILPVHMQQKVYHLHSPNI